MAIDSCLAVPAPFVHATGRPVSSSSMSSQSAYRRPIYKLPSAQSRALGDDGEAIMAHSTNNGAAQAISAVDFNERVKRMLVDKPDPKKGKQYQRTQFQSKRPAPQK
ncbi:hypothetical protein DK389_08575 [Methylobacterium durans]|uniref:Uncharacterized protein n=1 Tax=Methylobacterium durans TaxID=2202825 RepID=A0A2U8W3E2_9HYPH|nr:hypothetical protein DK389_08575 [Methylobacterium durans]